MDPTRPSDLDARLRSMTIVWIALMGGVVTYAVVAWALIEGAVFEPGDLAGTLGPWVPRIAVIAVAPLAIALAVARSAEDLRERRATPEQRMQAYFTRRVVAQALAEAPGLLMITVSLLAGSAGWALGSGLASVAVMSMTGPRREHLERLPRD